LSSYAEVKPEKNVSDGQVVAVLKLYAVSLSLSLSLSLSVSVSLSLSLSVCVCVVLCIVNKFGSRDEEEQQRLD